MSRSWSSAHDWKSCKGQKPFESSNLSISATSSEQSPLCSGAFLCLRTKKRHPPAPLLLLPKPDLLRWAPAWFLRWLEQSPLCSDAFLCLRTKKRHPPAPLLLLPKPDLLRWAPAWFLRWLEQSPLCSGAFLCLRTKGARLDMAVLPWYFPYVTSGVTAQSRLSRSF